VLRACAKRPHIRLSEDQSRRLYILCWRQYSRRKLSPTVATPTTLVLTTLVAQCELSRRKIGLLLKVVGRKFSQSPGDPATVGVVRWPAAGDTAGSSLRRLSSLQHRIYNLLEISPEVTLRSHGGDRRTAAIRQEATTTPTTTIYGCDKRSLQRIRLPA